MRTTENQISKVKLKFLKNSEEKLKEDKNEVEIHFKSREQGKNTAWAQQKTVKTNKFIKVAGYNQHAKISCSSIH